MTTYAIWEMGDNNFGRPLIKIGKVGLNGGEYEIRKRRAALQIGNPRRLEVLGYTDVFTEEEVHERFGNRGIRITGSEWFQVTDKVTLDLWEWEVLDEMYMVVLSVITGVLSKIPPLTDRNATAMRNFALEHAND